LFLDVSLLNEFLIEISNFCLKLDEFLSHSHLLLFILYSINLSTQDVSQETVIFDLKLLFSDLVPSSNDCSILLLSLNFSIESSLLLSVVLKSDLSILFFMDNDLLVPINNSIGLAGNEVLILLTLDVLDETFLFSNSFIDFLDKTGSVVRLSLELSKRY